MDTRNSSIFVLRYEVTESVGDVHFYPRSVIEWSLNPIITLRLCQNCRVRSVHLHTRHTAEWFLDWHGWALNVNKSLLSQWPPLLGRCSLNVETSRHSFLARLTGTDDPVADELIQFCQFTSQDQEEASSAAEFESGCFSCDVSDTLNYRAGKLNIWQASSGT